MDTVLDLDALSEAEGENWQWSGEVWLRPDYARCLIRLSRGGADAVVVREFDAESRAFVDNGFTVSEAKTHVAWRDRNAIYVGTDFGPKSFTESGFPRWVKLWRRGTPLEQAETLYEGNLSDVRVSAWRDHTEGFERDLLHRSLTMFTNELFLLRHRQLIKIGKPDDADATLYREWLLLKLRSEYQVEDRIYPAGALLVADINGFLAGERHFEVLFEPTERKSLSGFSTTQHCILLNILDNVKSRILVVRRENGDWVSSALPGVSEIATVTAWGIDSDKSDEYFLATTDFLTPTCLQRGIAGGGPPTELKRTPAFFCADGLEAKQFDALSSDGTRVPYFRVSRTQLEHNGKNPTLLYGYGGFENSIVPYYDSNVGAAWLEAGGVFVVANIRGGGEFGPRWHQAALKENRSRAYQDFIAVAEDLVARGVTSAQHLGAMGVSNGGLLVGNMLTARPDLFGAIVCMMPLLDMRRFNVLLAGPAWVGEYGNPDDPVEWKWLRKFSPYHNLSADEQYPPVLFTTSTRDDRVHPGHARKMAAKMLGIEHANVLFYENIEGGHAGAANNKQVARLSALVYSFLRRNLFPS